MFTIIVCYKHHIIFVRIINDLRDCILLYPIYNTKSRQTLAIEMSTKDYETECPNDSDSTYCHKESRCSAPSTCDCPSSLHSTAEQLMGLSREDRIHTDKEPKLKNTYTLLSKMPLFDRYDSVERLFMAARNQSVHIIKTLVQGGVNLSATDQYGHTVLHWTVLQDRSRVFQKQTVVRNLDTMVEIVRTLLSNGAQVNATTDCGITALHFAVNFGYTNVVAALLEHGADVHALVGKYIKHAETEECFNEVDQISFMYSVDDVLCSGYGSRGDPLTTILHIAVRHMYTEIVSILLATGATVDAKQYNGRTPLMLAVEDSRCEEVVGLLLDYGANINLVNIDGMTPLHYASRKNYNEVVKHLLLRGANVDSLNSCGKTPLVIAVEEGWVEVVDTLLQSGADIDRKDNCGMTILHIACSMARANAVALLLKAGADVNITCDDGRVAYELALATERMCRKRKQKSIKSVCTNNDQQLCDGHTLYWCDRQHKKSRYMLHLLKTHLNVMMYLDVPLHPHNTNERISNASYSVKHADKAVERFKNTIVCAHNNITIKNILDDRRDPVYVLNKCVMKDMNKILCELKIGIIETGMKNVLKFVTRKFKLRATLLTTGQDWLLDILSFSDNQLSLLPREVNRKILAYLSEEEMILAMGLAT